MDYTVHNEVWLSLVERYVRDVEVAGSNPVTSTIQSVLIVTERVSVRALCFFIHTLRSLFGSYGSS